MELHREYDAMLPSAGRTRTLGADHRRRRTDMSSTTQFVPGDLGWSGGRDGARLAHRLDALTAPWTYSRARTYTRNSKRCRASRCLSARICPTLSIIGRVTRHPVGRAPTRTDLSGSTRMGIPAT